MSVLARLNEPVSPGHARLIRTHLALIPVYGWLLVVWTAYSIDISTHGRMDRSGHIKGHDFAHFYVLGQIANARATQDLYSFEAQSRRMDQLVPHYENRFLPVHAPQVAMFFAPIARLPYETAVMVWLLLSAGLYVGCCTAMWAALPMLRSRGWIVAVLAAGFPACYALIAFGQTSAFALLWFTLGYLALKHDRPWLAGLAVGTMAYKPTLLLVVPLALLAARQFRVLGAAVMAASMQFGAVWVFFGKAALLGYLNNFREVFAFGVLLEARPHLMHSLKSFYSLLVPSPTVAMTAYVVSAVVITAIAIRTWKRQAPLELRYAVLLLATVLVNPHVYTYELVVLVPALMLVGAWALGRHVKAGSVWMWLALCFALPAFEPLTGATGLQLSVPAFVALFVWTAGAAR